MDVLVLIEKLDDVIHEARGVPLSGDVRVNKEEMYDLLDQMRATIPERSSRRVGSSRSAR